MKLSPLISMAFAIGCGDNVGGGRDGGASPDGAAAPDASAIDCEPPAAGAPGSPCTTPEDCDSAEGAGDGRCLNEDHRGVTWPETGYCVRICGADASDCGAGTTCFAQEGAGQILCMPTCCQGVACASGFACSTAFLGEVIGAGVCMPGDPSAADGTPCTSVADCNIDSNCVPDESGESGVCTTVGCTVGDDSTCAPGGDGHCVDEDGDGPEPPHCVSTGGILRGCVPDII